MLVLSRKIGDEILIGDNIRVTVVKSKNGIVRLGISAPDEIVIRRAEVPPLEKPLAKAVPTRLRTVQILPPPNTVLDYASLISKKG